MKASELRIGNLVYDHFNECAKVDFVMICNIEKMKLRPIPLTEEWHNRFGVVKNGFDSFEYELPRKNNISIKVVFTGDYVMLRQKASNSPIEDDIIAIWNKDLTGRDMFVHEWQNLYFALTGEELTLQES